MHLLRPFLTVFILFLAFPIKLNSQAVLIKGTPVHIVINREIKLASGDIQDLRNIKEFEIKFDYEALTKCDFNSEEAYLNNIRQKNSEKKANHLIHEWKTLPKTFESTFIDFFNKNASDVGISASVDTSGNKPMILIKVLREDPHYHQGENAAPPNISLECTFFDKEGNFLLRFTLTAFGSRKKDLSERFDECYAVAGKMLARDVTKRLIQWEEQNFKKE